MSLLVLVFIEQSLGDSCSVSQFKARQLIHFICVFSPFVKKFLKEEKRKKKREKENVEVELKEK